MCRAMFREMPYFGQCHISYEAREAQASGPLQSRGPPHEGCGIQYSYSLPTHYDLLFIAIYQESANSGSRDLAHSGSRNNLNSNNKT